MTNLPAVRAPEFPPAFAWLNTPAPLSLRALRGKIVLLDFWTHGCINCQHVLPDMEKLARKYLHALVVVGVHSAKFQNESSIESVRHAAARLEITHPVVIDEAMRLWSEYAVRAWPTFVLIDAAGKVTAQLSGEGRFEQLDALIAHAIAEAKSRAIFDDSPLPTVPQVLEASQSALRYPSKVIAHEDLIFIADSGHNRVIIARFQSETDAQVLAVAGNGARGFRDGDFADAAFAAPQGMALQVADDGAKTLFVADTANHAIRALDLQGRRVSTVAGTGQQARFGAAGGAARESDLSSPWDLALGNAHGDASDSNTLFIAMAGAHQIWALDLASQSLAPWAGSGREARVDGTRRDAAMAQPSGLAICGQNLIFADAESSSVRVARMPSGTIETLAGGDPDGPGLFTFGDRDGPRAEVLLQHPLAVAAREHNGALQVLVADTYNHKLKSIASDGSVHTIAGAQRGDLDSQAPLFDEPGGLAWHGSRLLVADTNNHKAKLLDLETGHAATLTLRHLEAPLPTKTMEEEDKLPPLVLRSQSVVQVAVEIVLPAGHHLSGDPRDHATLELQNADGTRQIVVPEASAGDWATDTALQFRWQSGLPMCVCCVLSLAISYCSDEAGVCKWKRLRLGGELCVSDSGCAETSVQARLEVR